MDLGIFSLLILIYQHTFFWKEIGCHIFIFLSLLFQLLNFKSRRSIMTSISETQGERCSIFLFFCKHCLFRLKELFSQMTFLLCAPLWVTWEQSCEVDFQPPCKHILYLCIQNNITLFNKQRSLDCALFCYKARRKRLEHERSVGRNTRRKNKLYFQSEEQCRQHALYSHKARYNKPIRILVRMVQII